MSFININNKQANPTATYSATVIREALLSVETKNTAKVDTLVKSIDHDLTLSEALEFFTAKLSAMNALNVALINEETQKEQDALEAKHTFTTAVDVIKLSESMMSEIDILAQEAKDLADFAKTFFKEYGDKIKKTADSMEWLEELYTSSITEALAINERSINKIQKEFTEVTTAMAATVTSWKEADGDTKSQLLDKLKSLTSRKKELVAELDTAVMGKDKDAVLTAVEESLVNEAKFFRLPKQLNAMWELKNSVDYIVGKHDNGDDYNPADMKTIEEFIKKIKQSAKAFKDAEEVKGTVYESVVNEAKFNKKSLMKAMKKDDGMIQLGNGQEYIIYAYDNGNDDNDAMWGDKTIFGLDQDGEEHEIEYSDIVSYNESVVTEANDMSAKKLSKYTGFKEVEYEGAVYAFKSKELGKMQFQAEPSFTTIDGNFRDDELNIEVDRNMANVAHAKVLGQIRGYKNIIAFLKGGGAEKYESGNLKEIERYLKKFDFKSISESVVNEAKPAGLSKEETLEVAQKFADALAEVDGVKVTVNMETLEEDSFDLDYDGTEFDGGSYNINADGSVVNMAVRKQPTVGTKDDDVKTIVKFMKKHYGKLAKNESAITDLVANNEILDLVDSIHAIIKELKKDPSKDSKKTSKLYNDAKPLISKLHSLMESLEVYEKAKPYAAAILDLLNAVEKAGNFENIGKELKAAGYEFEFEDNKNNPAYKVKHDGSTFAIANKKYWGRGYRAIEKKVGDIAIGWVFPNDTYNESTITEGKADYMARYEDTNINLKKGYKHLNDEELNQIYLEIGELIADNKLKVKDATFTFEAEEAPSWGNLIERINYKLNEDLRRDLKSYIKKNEDELYQLADDDNWDIIYNNLRGEFDIKEGTKEDKEMIETFRFLF